MQKKTLLFLLMFMAFCLNLAAQQWGYVTLIAPQNSTTATLIDTNNTVVKQWTGLSGQTAYSSYMLEGGYLWRTVKASGTSFMGGGICGRVQKVAWNGTILFDYEINTTEECSHHDICPMPNGNVLVIVYDKKTAAEVQAAGATANAVRWSEKIIELEPTGVNSANIVWEWYLWDHLVQNLYPNKANYQTSIVDHPELLNINYQNTATDWVHMNGIDYNATLDQIVVSSHNLNELWVIDHSTSTAQAATHSGGNGGKGGDLLYRWGNPAAYSASGSTIFNVVHDAHWVPYDCPHPGWLGGFNNKGVSNSISAIDLFQPPLVGYNYTITPGQAYQPATYGYRHPANGYSSNMGNSQQLPNGNMLVCLATASKVYEINAAGTQLWQYTSTGSIPQAWRYSRCYMEAPSVAVANSNPEMCSSGSVVLDITPAANATSSYTYNWSPSTGLSSTTAQDPTVSGISSNMTYTVTVTTAGGCTVTTSIPVSITPGPTADAGDDVTIQAGQSTTLTANGGGGYHWSNGANTASITVSPVATTTYTVTVTAANGCTATDEVVVNVISTPTAVSVSASPASMCAGESTQLNANASGGTGNYTYNWASTPSGFSSNQSNPLATPTTTTTYKVTVSDGITSATASILVTVYPLPVANAGNNVSILLGNSTTLMANGGGTYAWSNGANTASTTVAPSSTTTYTVTVTSANGCTQEDDVTVTVTIPPLTAAVSVSNATLCAGESSDLLANATGGTGNYSYAWSSSPAGFSSSAANPSVSPSVTTTYTVTISDGNTSATASATVLVNPLPNANAGNNVSIFLGNTATLTATGGGTYAWSNGANTASTTVAPMISTLYTVTVTSANGCSKTDEVLVTVTIPPLTVSVSVPNSTICAGDPTQLIANAGGGTSNYSYSWSSNPAGFSSSAANPTVSPTVTTTYTVTLSDGNSSATASATVLVNTLPNANAGADVSILIGSAATLTASGGGNYLWSSGASTASISVAPTLTTTYTVTVSNANGCSATDMVTVTVTGTLLSTVVSASNATLCLGASTQLMAVTSGGTGNYSYNWAANGVNFSSLAQPMVSPTVNTLYEVTVTDGISTVTGSTQVLVNPLPAANAGPDVSIPIGSTTTLTASGGSTYLWSTGETSASISVTPALSTTYTVTVTDANGCSATDDVLVTVTGSPLSVVVSAANANICLGGSTQLSAIVSGGTGNYSYLWFENGMSFSTQSQPVVSPAISTNYTVSITDGVTIITGSIQVTVVPTPVANAGDDVSILFGSSTTLTATGNGSYLWSNGSTDASITVSPSVTSSYTVVVTGASGCASSDQVLVTVTYLPLTLNLSAGSTTLCAGASTQLHAVGSGGNGNYTYSWISNPAGFTSNQSEPTVSPSVTTIYTAILSDGSGTAIGDISIVVNPTPLANAGIDQAIVTGQSAQLTATGGGSYLWSTGDTNASISVTPSISTIYTVTVTSTAGCSASDEVAVILLPLAPLLGSVSASDSVLCTGDIAQLFVTATGGTGIYTYAWSSDPAGFSSTLPDPYINPEQTTVYTVVISDGVSSISLNFVVLVNPLPLQPTITPVDSSLVSSSPSNNQWFYYGNPIVGATGQVFAPTEDGSYQVQTVDANGCYSPLSDPYEVGASATHDLFATLSWKIIPNPASQIIRIEGDFDGGNSTVEIWNSMGIQVLRVENSREISVSELPCGSYVLRLSSKQGAAAKKLMIIR